MGLFLEIGFYLGMRFFEKGCLSLKGHSCKLCVAPFTLRKVSGTSARWHHFDRHLVVPQSSAWPEVVCETKPLEGDPGWQGGWSLQEAHWSLAVFVSQQCLGSAFASIFFPLLCEMFWTLFPMGWMKVCLPGGSCKAWHPMTTGSRSWNLCCSLPLPQEFPGYHQVWVAICVVYPRNTGNTTHVFFIPHQKQPNPQCQIWNKDKIQNSFKFQKKRFVIDLMATMCLQATARFGALRLCKGLSESRLLNLRCWGAQRIVGKTYWWMQPILANCFWIKNVWVFI